MRAAAEEAGRDPASIEVTTAGAPKKAFIEGLAAQGVSRVLISPATGDLDELRGSLERFQREIGEPLAD